jgi:hypothetical protein
MIRPASERQLSTISVSKAVIPLTDTTLVVSEGVLNCPLVAPLRLAASSQRERQYGSPLLSLGNLGRKRYHINLIYKKFQHLNSFW